MKITILLPWPDSALSPNSRSMWGKIKATEYARVNGCYEMLQQAYGAICPPGPLVCKYRFYPPSKRWFDDDNLIASMKAWRDGIFDFWGGNDHAVIETRGRRCEVRKGGAVEVTIEEDGNE
jgi:crossover junction endodeoxyribonuclease RusA